MGVTVIVVVDELLVREGLVRLLAERPEFEVSAWRPNEPRLLPVVVEAHPDVVVVNDSAATIELAFAVAKLRPRTGLIVLSRDPDGVVVRTLLDGGLGRRGYVLDDSFEDGEQLVAAIGKVAAGGSEIDPRVVESLVEQRRREESPLARLSASETQVLAEVATGKSNAAIATTLGITQRGVERHIHDIFPKIGLPDDPSVSRRVAATLLYLRDSLALERAERQTERTLALQAQALIESRRRQRQ
jgi:DNA-binding NarL/FixJ family response regulator